MEALKEQLEGMQRNLDSFTGEEGSMCPTCGLFPYELAKTIAEMVDREVEERIIEREQRESTN